MKELQKYYAVERPHELTDDCHYQCIPVYIASEADAAFAALKQQHAEEIERLKAHTREGDALVASTSEVFAESHDRLSVALAENERLRKQAERYEKLRKLNVPQFKELFIRNLHGDVRFDDLVDQLPGRSEASIEEQSSRTE